MFDFFTAPTMMQAIPAAMIRNITGVMTPPLMIMTNSGNTVKMTPK